jgi:hypothetical protein
VRRILVLLTVVALMMVMLAMSVGPAFAANCTGPKAERPAACKGVGPDQGRGSQQTGP